MDNRASRKRIIIAAMLGAFWSPFVATSVNVALPAIGGEYNVSSVLLGWIVSASILSTAMFVLPIGKISDMYGRKKTMFLGAAIMTLTSLLSGLSGSVTALIIFRGIQGIGAAMVVTTVVSIITSVFPPSERGKVLGINVAFTYIGLSASPFISGLIVNYIHWRGVFFFSVPVGLLLLLTLSGVGQEWKEPGSLKMDYTGSLIFAAGIFAGLWGLSNVNQGMLGKISLVFGILILVLFTVFERRTTNPLLDILAIKSNRILIFSSLASCINYSSTFAISYLMSLYLQSIQGISPQNTGIILLVQPAFQALFSPLAGRLSDRVDPQYAASAGMALISACLLFLGMFGMHTPVFWIVIVLSIIGVGFALFTSPNTNSIMSSVEKKYYGIAAGILSSARTVGQSFSMAVTALIASFYLGESKISAETGGLFMQSFKTTFIIFSALCALGVWASMTRGKRTSLKAQ